MALLTRSVNKWFVFCMLGPDPLAIVCKKEPHLTFRKPLSHAAFLCLEVLQWISCPVDKIHYQSAWETHTSYLYFFNVICWIQWSASHTEEFINDEFHPECKQNILTKHNGSDVLQMNFQLLWWLEEEQLWIMTFLLCWFSKQCRSGFR